MEVCQQKGLGMNLKGLSDGDFWSPSSFFLGGFRLNNSPDAKLPRWRCKLRDAEGAPRIDPETGLELYSQEERGETCPGGCVRRLSASLCGESCAGFRLSACLCRPLSKSRLPRIVSPREGSHIERYKAVGCSKARRLQAPATKGAVVHLRQPQIVLLAVWSSGGSGRMLSALPRAQRPRGVKQDFCAAEVARAFGFGLASHFIMSLAPDGCGRI